MSDTPTPPAALAATRASIDAVDHALVELLAQRRALVAELFAQKLRHGIPLVDPAREVEILADRTAFAEERGISTALIDRVMRAILDASHEDAENLAREATPG